MAIGSFHPCSIHSSERPEAERVAAPLEHSGALATSSSTVSARVAGLAVARTGDQSARRHHHECGEEQSNQARDANTGGRAEAGGAGESACQATDSSDGTRDAVTSSLASLCTGALLLLQPILPCTFLVAPSFYLSPIADRRRVTPCISIATRCIRGRHRRRGTVPSVQPAISTHSRYTMQTTRTRWTFHTLDTAQCHCPSMWRNRSPGPRAGGASSPTRSWCGSFLLPASSSPSCSTATSAATSVSK